MSPTSPAPLHQAPAALNLTLVASGGPPTGRLSLAATGGRLLPHTQCPDGPCGDPGPHHGTSTRYVHHACRCTHCRAAHTAKSGTRRRLIAYGRWHPLTDAEPARHHIRALQAAGLTWRQIADTAGVHIAVIRNLMSGNAGSSRPPTRRMRPDNAAAILAIRAPRSMPDGGSLVDATGTARRIQALVALGFSSASVAREAGLTTRTVSDVERAVLPLVWARTAAAVAGAYDRMWDQDPGVWGVRSWDARAARERAAVAGWAPPMAWDEDPGSKHCIDDPGGWPEWTGQCGKPGGAHAHIAAGSVPCARCVAVPFGAECGTRRGYDEHRELGTETCRECRDVINDAARERKQRRRARQKAAA